MLTTFTNPTPVAGDSFGFSVAALGTDRVLIGTRDAGAAYLFSTNGAVLTTFTNPTPPGSDYFGWSVAAAGINRVLIGAPGDNTGAIGAGAAHLFSTNGALLTTFTNPTPAANDQFGSSVAAVGTDRVLMGAPSYWQATGPGAAYLFSIQPVLTIRLTSTNTVAVSWPSPWTDWTLQENTNDVASDNWSNAPGPMQDDGTTKTLIINPSKESGFYRLFKPSP
jgi:hypothetical protein